MISGEVNNPQHAAARPFALYAKAALVTRLVTDKNGNYVKNKWVGCVQRTAAGGGWYVSRTLQWQGAKGDRHLLCQAPEGPFRQKGPVPFFPQASMNETNMEQTVAGVVLAGGRSSRIGRPKAWLPFGPELMLQRVVRLLGEVVRPVVIAAHAGQELPELPPWTQVVCDRADNRGPMEGLATALEHLQGRAELAFVAGCDAPFLAPPLVRRMIALADGFDIAVPQAGGLDHPLAAVYRVQLFAQIRESVSAGSRRLAALLDQVRTRRVTADELIDVDPGLSSLVNINTLADYQSALRLAGFGGI